MKTLYLALIKLYAKTKVRSAQFCLGENLLSALGIQQWYEVKELQASALLRSLILNNPFQDGNKRTAYVVAMMVSTINKPDDEVERCLIEIAKGNLKEIDEIASILYNMEP